MEYGIIHDDKILNIIRNVILLSECGVCVLWKIWNWNQITMPKTLQKGGRWSKRSCYVDNERFEPLHGIF